MGGRAIGRPRGDNKIETMRETKGRHQRREGGDTPGETMGDTLVTLGQWERDLVIPSLSPSLLLSQWRFSLHLLTHSISLPTLSLSVCLPLSPLSLPCVGTSSMVLCCTTMGVCPRARDTMSSPPSVSQSASLSPLSLLCRYLKYGPVLYNYGSLPQTWEDPAEPHNEDAEVKYYGTKWGERGGGGVRDG